MTPAVVRRIVTAVVVIALLLAAVWVAVRIPRTLSMFLIAALIAFGASPLVRALERRMPRAAAIAAVYLGLIGGLVLLVLVVVPISYGQILALVAHTSEYVQASQDLVANFERFLHARFGNHLALPTVDQLGSEVGSRVGAVFALTVESIGTILVTTANALLVGLSALILSVFLLAQGREIRSGVLNLVPAPRREKTNALLVEVASIFGHFVAGQLALCAIVGVVVWLTLAPAHFAFALLLALVCAVGYAVPFVGMLVAQAIAAILAIPQGGGMVLYVSLAIFVVARVADNLLVPKIMGGSVGVSPIAVMFAVFAGGELFGLWGLILGIPAAALVRVLFTYFVLPWIVHAQGSESASSAEAIPGAVPPLHEVSYADAR